MIIKNRARLLLLLTFIFCVSYQGYMYAVDGSDGGEYSHEKIVENDDEIEFKEDFDEEIFFVDAEKKIDPLWKIYMQNIGIYVLTRYISLKQTITYYGLRLKKSLLLHYQRLNTIKQRWL